MMEFNATFIVAMISFVVFMFIMNAIFYRPILNIMRKRDDYISGNYNEAEKFNTQTEDLKTEKENKLHQIRLDCKHSIETTIDTAQKNSNAEISASKEKSKEQIQAGKEELISQSGNLKEAIESSVIGEISKSITDKILNGKSVNV